MSQPISWVQMGNAYLYSSKTIDAATAPITTNKDISPGGATAGLAFAPPVPLAEGNKLRVTARGWLKAGTGNLELGLAWGGAAGKILAITRAITPITATAELPWSMYASIKVTNVKGTEGIMLTQGDLFIPIAAKSATVGQACFPLPDVTKSGGEATGVDVSKSNVLTLIGKFSEASTNEIQVTHWDVELIT